MLKNIVLVYAGMGKMVEKSITFEIQDISMFISA